MDDSFMLARLTLMLLRASLANPDSLPVSYGVIILPSDEVLSQERALLALGRLHGPLQVSAEAVDGNLIVSVRALSESERTELEIVAPSFVEGMRNLRSRHDPEALVRAVGFRDEFLVPAAVVERWLSVTNCSYCSLALGLPGPKDPPEVVAVLYVGHRDR